MKRLHFIASLPIAIILTGCSEAPKQAAEAAKAPDPPAEPIGAQSAIRQMWIKARSWSVDAQPLRVTSMNLKEVKSQDGKCGAWDATFVSPGRGRTRRYTYSVVSVPESNLHKGVFAGPEDTWSPGGQMKPITIQAVKTDTTAAFEAAMKKGGADFSKKNPELPIAFLLESTKRFPNPAWRVIWGESISTSNFSVFVDATTGEYLQTAR